MKKNIKLVESIIGALLFIGFMITIWWAYTCTERYYNDQALLYEWIEAGHYKGSNGVEINKEDIIIKDFIVPDDYIRFEAHTYDCYGELEWTYHVAVHRSEINWDLYLDDLFNR